MLAAPPPGANENSSVSPRRCAYGASASIFGGGPNYPLSGCYRHRDRGASQVTLAHAHEANQRIVEQLNDQVDFLNRQLANREAELSEVGKVEW